MKTRMIAAAAAGLIAAGLAFGAQAQQGCVKQVFNKYCLGGDVQSLIKKYPPVRTSTAKDGATVYTFADGADQTEVTAVQGRISMVFRHQHPGVQATFDQVERDLRGIYGEPRRTNNGKGATTSMWDRGDWRIVLTHAVNRGEVNLSYRHENLQAARRAGTANYGSNVNSKGY